MFWSTLSIGWRVSYRNVHYLLYACIILYCPSTKKVVHSLSWDKTNTTSPASREVPMTKQVVQALESLGDKTLFLGQQDHCEREE